MESMSDVRAVLAATIDDLRNDRATPATVNAISNAMGKYLNTYRLQLEYSAAIGDKPHIPALAE